MTAGSDGQPNNAKDATPDPAKNVHKAQVHNWRAGTAASIVGIIATIVGAVWTYNGGGSSSQPSQQSSQNQSGGSGNTLINTVVGNVTINQPSASTPSFNNPTDAARVELRSLGVGWDSRSFVG